MFIYDEITSFRISAIILRCTHNSFQSTQELQSEAMEFSPATVNIVNLIPDSIPRQLGIQQKQFGHRTKPFSLHSGQRRSCSSSSSNTFRLPLQLVQGTNLTSAQLSQVRPGRLTGNPSRSLLNSPASCSWRTSSAPPMCRPPMNTCGNTIGFFPSSA